MTPPTPAPALSLLVGADEFWRAAAADIARARRRVLVQAMTFEGDAAGLRVARAIAASAAADRRVLVDSYTRYVVNDRFVRSRHYLTDAAFRGEVRRTHAMFASLAAAGIGVRRTNPTGMNPLTYAARNHKKLIVADDVAYVGGINFSDHNFAWHDLMLRIDCARSADFLARDFALTFGGRARLDSAVGADVTLHALDGRTNADGFRPVFAAIGAARRRIVVVSPYLTFPFTGALEAAATRGVTVEIVTPSSNNKPIVRDHLIDHAMRAGFIVHALPTMSHMKAMLIDDERLILGSSNFDFASYHAEEELIAIVDDPGIIADFVARVLDPAIATARGHHAAPPPRWRAAHCHATLRLAAAGVARFAQPVRHAVDWR